MQSPYDILDVAATADDTEIKQAYLNKVKLNPPELDPDKFQALHHAYESIKNAQCRLSYELFNYSTVSFDTLLDQAFAGAPPAPLDSAQFERLLSTSLSDNTFYLPFKTS